MIAANSRIDVTHFSWRLLTGKYKILICLIGLASGVNFWLADNMAKFLLSSYFTSGLIILAVLDYLYGLLYNRLLIGLVMPAIMWRLWLGESWTGISGGAVALLSLYLLRWLSHNGLGLGDVKLAAVLGYWLGITKVMIALAIAFGLGGLFGLGVIMYRHDKNCRTPIPFGPFLVIGGYVGFWQGEVLWQWYEAFLL